MQRVEVGTPIKAKDHGLTVDDELLDPISHGRLDDPWEALRPIVAAARLAKIANLRPGVRRPSAWREPQEGFPARP
jgi:hypothetical protein